ncbi:MAG: protein-export chaperone SecB [Porticoccaceae bacterium]|nr:protein-export chaperone SecB [Porticoccaceae bacterium]
MSKDKPKTDTDQGADGVAAPQMAIKHLYIKDVSFEAPLGTAGFSRKVKPVVDQDIGTEVRKIDEQHYEVVLHLTASVKDDSDTLYLVEVQQAGVFLVTGLEQNMLTQVLNTHCLSVLFPYARAIVDDLAVKGGFPPLMLPPVNFEALFQQALAQRAQSADAEASPEQRH